VRIVCILLQALSLVVFARVVLEWIPVGEAHPVGRLRHVLRLVTQPLLAPLRAVIPPIRMGSVAVDLSPVILIVALSVIAGLIC
jgi:YggT family protein